MKALLRPEGDSEAGAEAQAGLRVTTNDNTKLELAISAHMQTLAVLCEGQPGAQRMLMSPSGQPSMART